MIKKIYILLLSILAIVPLLAKTILYKNGMDTPVTLTINEGNLIEIPARSCKSVEDIKRVNVLTIHTDKDNATDTLKRSGMHPEIDRYSVYDIVRDRITPLRNFRLLNQAQALFHDTKVNCDQK